MSHHRFVTLGLAALLASRLITAGAAAAPGEASREQVDRLLQFGRSADAVRLARVLAERQPQDVMTQLLLARALLLDRRFEPAIAVATPLLTPDLQPAGEAAAEAILGEAHRKSGRSLEALAAYEAAREPAAIEGREFPWVQLTVKRGMATANWRIETGATTVMYLPPDTRLTNAGSLVRAFDLMNQRLQRATGVGVPGPIEVYCFNDYAQWQQVLGEGQEDWGVPDERAIYYMLGRTMFNTMIELGHYIGAPELRAAPEARLLRNGLGAYLAGGNNWGGRVAQTAPGLHREGRLAPLEELMRSDEQSNTLAAIGGSFVRFLIDRYGAERFRRLWCGYNDGPEVWEQVYGTPLATLDAQWRETL